MIKGKCRLYIDEPMLEGHWFFCLPEDKISLVTGGLEDIEYLDPVYGKDITITYKGVEVFSGYTGFEPIPEDVNPNDWMLWFKEEADITINKDWHEQNI